MSRARSSTGDRKRWIPTERAWLFVFFDGHTVGGVYASKASIFRADDIAIADTENLAQLSVNVTPLSYNGGAPFEWIEPAAMKVTATGSVVLNGGAVESIVITDGGSGYTSAPTVTVTGDGTGATATATISDGVVTSVTVDTPGSGYSTATVEFSAP